MRRVQRHDLRLLRRRRPCRLTCWCLKGSGEAVEGQENAVERQWKHMAAVRVACTFGGPLWYFFRAIDRR